MLFIDIEPKDKDKAKCANPKHHPPRSLADANDSNNDDDNNNSTNRNNSSSSNNSKSNNISCPYMASL